MLNNARADCFLLFLLPGVIIDNLKRGHEFVIIDTALTEFPTDRLRSVSKGFPALVEKFTTQLFYAQSVSVNLLVNSTSAGLGIG